MSGHEYLSTACLHEIHDYCVAEIGLLGRPKTPKVCKWCGAPCRCRCHNGLTSAHSDGTSMGVSVAPALDRTPVTDSAE